MSVDTCQKYSLCPEKAVCGVTVVPPAANLDPPPPPPRDSVQPRKKLPLFALREKESKREPAGRVISTTPLG